MYRSVYLYRRHWWLTLNQNTLFMDWYLDSVSSITRLKPILTHATNNFRNYSWGYKTHKTWHQCMILTRHHSSIRHRYPLLPVQGHGGLLESIPAVFGWKVGVHTGQGTSPSLVTHRQTTTLSWKNLFLMFIRVSLTIYLSKTESKDLKMSLVSWKRSRMNPKMVYHNEYKDKHKDYREFWKGPEG